MVKKKELLHIPYFPQTLLYIVTRTSPLGRKKHSASRVKPETGDRQQVRKAAVVKIAIVNILVMKLLQISFL